MQQKSLKLAALGLIAACSSPSSEQPGRDSVIAPPEQTTSSAAPTSPTAPTSPPAGSEDPNAPPSPNEAGPAPGGQVEPNEDAKPADPEKPWSPPVENGPVALPYTAYRCGYAIRQLSPSKPNAMFHADVGSAPPRNLHLTVAGNADTSVVMQWSTDDATQASEVRFGDSPTNLDRVARGYSFSYGVSNRRQHAVHLCGLEPGRTYYYDAGGSKARSAIYKVTTAPADASDVKLLVGGDTRSDPQIWANLAKKAIAQGATALLMTGDAVATGSNQGEWDALFESAPELFAQLPGIWAHGNHEGLDDVYFAQLALADNGGASGIGQWFATTYGPVRFVVLNDTVSSSSVITGVERTFLEGTLKAVDRARTPFVVALHHKPPYTTSSGHSSATDVRGAWTPLYDEYHVNAVLNGHVHSYESTKPLRGGTASSIGQVTTNALGTRYLVFGGGGAGLYGFTTNQSWIQARESVHGYAIISANATEMKWTAFREDGSTIETIAMPK
jgi:acid phosphatase type 7